jgi:hydrogenase/urease accessory protein HupE
VIAGRRRHLLRLVRRVVGPIALGGTLLASSALAHMMPAQQGTLNLLGPSVFAALSLPVSAFRGVDDNGDGRLSQVELTAHLVALQAQLGRRVRFFNATREGRLDLVMPMVEPDERDSTSLAGSTHVLVLMKSTFDAAPEALRMEADAFGTAANERQLTLKATRGPDAEAIVLTPARRTHRFFRGPWEVLGDYTRLGVTHILGGTDHLLFLLTIIVAAAGWRYWLGVLTSFTVAHSLTLSLSLLGIVRVPAATVEPLIAASIVLMALLNLREGHAVVRWRRMAVVFACGLLHGLGFASALSDMGVSGRTRFASLVGFNVGIELGQAVFLGALLVIGVVARSAGPGWWTRSQTVWPRAMSWTAAGLGTIWFVQRLALSAAASGVPR